MRLSYRGATYNIPASIIETRREKSQVPIEVYPGALNLSSHLLYLVRSRDCDIVERTIPVSEELKS
jgi:hypothetical protein